MSLHSRFFSLVLGKKGSTAPIHCDWFTTHLSPHLATRFPTHWRKLPIRLKQIQHTMALARLTWKRLWIILNLTQLDDAIRGPAGNSWTSLKAHLSFTIVQEVQTVQKSQLVDLSREKEHLSLLFSFLQLDWIKRPRPPCSMHWIQGNAIVDPRSSPTWWRASPHNFPASQLSPAL